MDKVYPLNVSFKAKTFADNEGRAAFLSINYKAMDGLLGGYVKQRYTVYDNA